jgi:hypothetical protein
MRLHVLLISGVPASTYLVSIETLEQIHHLLEEVTDFLLCSVASVAAGIDGVDASTVLAPLVGPEALVVTVDVDPVLLHVGQKIVATLFLQDVRDVGVGTSGVTAGLVGAITVVGPVSQ